MNAGNLTLAETIELRKAAQAQVDQAVKAVAYSQLQTAQSFMPVLVLTTVGRTLNSVPHFEVKNIGSGAALNAHLDPFFLDGRTQAEFRHRAAIGAGEQLLAVLAPVGSSSGLLPNDVTRVLQYEGAIKEIPITITYDGISGQQYTTKHTVLLTNDRADLRIRFDGFSTVMPAK